MSKDATYGGVVYFLAMPDFGRVIKIGKADRGQLDSRLADARKYNGALGREQRAIVLAIVRTHGKPRTLEARVHEYFAACRVNPEKILNGSELFFADDVIPFVQWLRQHYYVAQSEEEFNTYAECTHVEPSTNWLPRVDRVRVYAEDTDKGFFGDEFMPNPPEWWEKLPARKRFVADEFIPARVQPAICAIMGGQIDLDVASNFSADALHVHAKQFFDEYSNGLKQSWGSVEHKRRVWLFPPKGGVEPWIEKAVSELRAGHVEELIVMVPTRTTIAKYWREFHKFHPSIGFIEGRFEVSTKPDGSEKESEVDGYFFFYIGENAYLFVRELQKIEGGVAWTQ